MKSLSKDLGRFGGFRAGGGEWRPPQHDRTMAVIVLGVSNPYGQITMID